MRSRLLLAAATAIVLAAVPARAGRGGHGSAGHGFHHGHRSFHHGSGGRVFLHIGPLFPPWGPYYAPYPVYPYLPPPPPPDEGWSAPPEPTDDDDERAPLASYGLVQLRGIPEGAAVDLDGRFWLTAAAQLERRWLALPEGEHRLTVRLDGAEPVDRYLAVHAGKTQVVRLGPFPRAPD